jgi:hypothetical protein
VTPVLGDPDTARVAEKLLSPGGPVIGETKGFLDKSISYRLLVGITLQNFDSRDTSGFLRVLDIFWHTVPVLDPYLAPSWGINGTAIGTEGRHLTIGNGLFQLL